MSPEQRGRVERAFLEACRLDVAAIKPGNVSFDAPGHGMQAEDFLRSAEAAAPCIADPGLGVGARVLAAARATWSVVNCNTNIGILLLCAPLAVAAGGSLRAVLHGLGRRDAIDAYEALRLAAPAGLGQVEQHDVMQPPQVTLLEAMLAARSRDLIARQYANGFSEVLTLGLPAVRRSLARGRSPEQAMTEVFLMFLSLLPDSHVARKHGIRCARDLRRAAAARRVDVADRAALLAWDAELKRRGINPGTSADLSVATWFALRLEAPVKTG